MWLPLYRIYKLHDAKDKDFELEMSWLCEESNWVHTLVPADVLEEAKAAGVVSTVVRVIVSPTVLSLCDWNCPKWYTPCTGGHERDF